MLARIDSRELAEWEAFERAFGPLDYSWRDDMLARLHEIMQSSDSMVRNKRPHEVHQAILDFQDQEAERGTEEEQKQATIDAINAEMDE